MIVACAVFDMRVPAMPRRTRCAGCSPGQACGITKKLFRLRRVAILSSHIVLLLGIDGIHAGITESRDLPIAGKLW